MKHLKKGALCYANVIIQVAVLATMIVSANAAPSNPNATQEVKDQLQYLVSISGKKILSGEESMWGDGTFPSRLVTNL